MMYREQAKTICTRCRESVKLLIKSRAKEQAPIKRDCILLGVGNELEVRRMSRSVRQMD